MDKKSKLSLFEWVLDRANDVCVAGYGLASGGTWLQIAISGDGVPIPDVAYLVATTLALFVVWGWIGFLKATIEGKK